MPGVPGLGTFSGAWGPSLSALYLYLSPCFPNHWLYFGLMASMPDPCRYRPITLSALRRFSRLHEERRKDALRARKDRTQIPRSGAIGYSIAEHSAIRSCSLDVTHGPIRLDTFCPSRVVCMLRMHATAMPCCPQELNRLCKYASLATSLLLRLELQSAISFQPIWSLRLCLCASDKFRLAMNYILGDAQHQLYVSQHPKV